MKTRKLPHVRHAPCSQRAPFTTSGRFRRPNQPETPCSADVSSGRRIRQQATSAKNRTEAQDPRQNQRPFPAEPSRTRGAPPAGEAASRQRRHGRNPRHRSEHPSVPCSPGTTRSRNPSSRRSSASCEVQEPQDEGGGEAGRVQIHRALLQHAKDALIDRL